MKKSLAVKMFVTLLLSFLSVITITISFLFMYFQFFYEDEKIGRVIDAMNNFSYEYLSEDWSESQLYQNIAAFSNENGIEFSVYDYAYLEDEFYDNGEYAYIEMEEAIKRSNESYYYITTVNQESYYDFMLTSNEYNALKSYNAFNNNDGINLKGYIDDYNFLIVEFINGVGVESANTYVSEHDMSDYQTFEGSVVMISAQEVFDVDMSSIQYNSFYIEEGSDVSELTEGIDVVSPEVLLESFDLEDYNFETNEKNGVTYTITHIPYTEYDQVSFSKSLVHDGSDLEFYGFLSMQPVGEIIEMITSIIPYFLIGSLLLALVISYFYSRTVAKPIVELTEVADRMAGMDLDVVAKINRVDELGVLSTSLNTLATNLRESMDELVMKNKQLALDVEQKVLQEEARKAFVANASHELKTPLGVIKSYTEAINDGIKVEKKDYYMSVIMEEISHMDKLIQEMLILSKYDGGGQMYMKNSFDLDPLVQSTKESLTEIALKKNMQITIKTPLGDVLGDQDKIYQVLMNLVTNAIKYGNSDSEIRIESIDKDKTREIYVYNECPSINETDLEKIWERFYKVDVSHNKQIEGNGLGLAIVKSILEGHRSEFGVYNTIKGVCFYFNLDKEEVDI